MGDQRRVQRAILCLVLAVLQSHNSNPTASEIITLTLASQNYSLKEYAMPDFRVIGVKVKVQLSSSRCDVGESFGYSDHTVWVDGGCRAEFFVTIETVAQTTSNDLFPSMTTTVLRSSFSVSPEGVYTTSGELITSFSPVDSTRHSVGSPSYLPLQLSGTSEESTTPYTGTLRTWSLDTSLMGTVSTTSFVLPSISYSRIMETDYAPSSTETNGVSILSENDYLSSTVDNSLTKVIPYFQTTAENLLTIDKPYYHNITNKTTIERHELNKADNISVVNTTLQERNNYSPENIPIKQIKGCCCKRLVSQDQDQDVQSVVTRIRNHLQVPVKNLSKFRRKKTSAQDNRTSSVSLGSTGVVLLFLAFALILVSDLLTRFRYIKMD